MRILLVSIFLITLMGMIFIPSAFGVTYLVKIPYGSSTGDNYDPNQIEIQKGDTVKWSNLDRNTAHTVTSTATDGYAMQEANKGNHPNKGAYGYSGLFDSGEMRANNESNGCYPNCKPSFSYTFAYGGTFTYECRIHSWMQGVVKVIELGQDAETKKHGDAGDMYIDKLQYEVTENKSAKIKIYGKVKNPGVGDRIDFTITKPDGSTSELKTYRTGDGYYQLILSVNYEDRGTYNVVSTFGLKNIGTANFEVIKRQTPTIENTFPPSDNESDRLVKSSSTLTIGTDFQSYKKGDMIKISGTVPYLTAGSSNRVQLIIQIFDPRNNLVTVSQFFPNEDRTYSASINSNGPMWKFEGDYITRTSYALEQASTKFFLIHPGNTLNTQSPVPSTQSKTSTLLILDSIPSTFEAQGQNSQAEVIISGKLTSSDRQYVITSAKIQLESIFSDMKLPWGTVTLTTDGNGEFSYKSTWDVGDDWGVYAVFDGTSNFEPSKSQTEYFDVRAGAFQPQTTAPTEDSSPAGGVVFLLVIIMIVVIVAIAIKKRKKKILVTTQPPSGRGTAGTATITKPRKTPLGGKAPLLRQQIRQAKMAMGRQAKMAMGRQSPKTKSYVEPIHYMRCKHCHLEEFLENEADGQQYCTKCGWKKR